MSDCNFQFYSKLYDELLRRNKSNPDKYEREDAFMSIVEKMSDDKDEKEIYEIFYSVFKNVHNIELSESIFGSCYHLVKGFRK